MSKKQIQIDMDLFRDIVDFFYGDPDEDEDIERRIRRGIEDKVERLVAHNLFSQYKKANDPDERNRLRIEYLDHIGMPKSYRTDNEWHDDPPEDL